MNFEFRDRRIAGMLTVVPANERTFLEDMKAFDFPEAKSLKLKTVMGFDRHRLATAETAASDLIVFGFQHLIEQKLLDPASLDALVVVTQSPDYFIPPTSNVVQGRLGLKSDMLCIDINQGCAGFLIGLMQAFMLLDQPAIGRVGVVNADILSHKVSPKDKNSFPLTGDAAAITIVERGDGQTIHANLKMDGARADALIIPAGGFRKPSSPETTELRDVGENNWRALDHLTMNGTAVFNFVQTEVPPMIDALIASAGANKDDIDSFVFHQPNRFMLEKLADKMGVKHEKMPSNVVEHFGNASGATIPTCLTFNLASRLLNEPLLLCFAGFGVGLTWASMLMRVGPLSFCELIDYPTGGAGQ